MKIPAWITVRTKAIVAALVASLVPYLIFVINGGAFSSTRLEVIFITAVGAAFGVHIAPANKLTKAQRAKLRANPILPLGKAPARRDDRDLKMHHYLDGLVMPSGAIGITDSSQQWGMLGNATVGDCVWAGADHETMLWTASNDDAAVFSDATAISDYSAVTGYSPSKPNSDQGTDVRTAYAYRIATGVVDVAEARHKLAAYLTVDLDVDHIAVALSLFGAVGVGIQFPSSAMDQFNAGQPWDVVSGATIEGGHYIPIVGYDPTKGLWYVLTWGKLQAMTTAFLLKYADEHYALLSAEAKIPPQLNWSVLQSDLANINTPITTDPTPAPSPDAADEQLAAVLHKVVLAKSEPVYVKTAATTWLTDKGL